MSDPTKISVTALVTFEVELDDETVDLVIADRIHDAAMSKLPGGYELEEITSWDLAE